MAVGLNGCPILEGFLIAWIPTRIISDITGTTGPSWTPSWPWKTLGGWNLCFSCQERWSGVLGNARVFGSGIQRFVQQALVALLRQTRFLVSLRRRNAPPCCLADRGAKMETECRFVSACEQLLPL